MFTSRSRVLTANLELFPPGQAKFLKKPPKQPAFGESPSFANGYLVSKIQPYRTSRTTISFHFSCFFALQRITVNRFRFFPRNAENAHSSGCFLSRPKLHILDIWLCFPFSPKSISWLTSSIKRGQLFGNRWPKSIPTLGQYSPSPHSTSNLSITFGAGP